MHKLLQTGSILVSLYILWPSIKDWILANTTLELLRRMPSPKLTTVGLINRGNDCFANANIQALAGCPNFYLYLHQLQFSCPDKSTQLIRLSRTLSSLISELNEPVFSPKSVTVQPIISAIEQIHQKYLSRSQHDAHEMLHLLLETIQLEVIALQKNDPKIPSLVFEGSTIDTIKCKVCGYTKRAASAPFLVLTLAVPHKRATNLETLLRYYLAGDMISDYNCPRCQIINYLHQHPEAEYRQYLDLEDIPELPLLPGVSSPIVKSTQFDHLPESLAVHLNRSMYSGGAQRNSCKLEVPEYLELRNDKVLRKYRLCSLLRHSGTHASGHYESARRKNLEFWRKQNHQFDDLDLVPQRRIYSSSVKSSRSIDSQSSSAATKIESMLPFPAPATPQASVQQTQAQVSHSAPPSPAQITKNHTGPKFWSISDTVVVENTLGQAIGKQSSNYLVFYEKVRDTPLA